MLYLTNYEYVKVETLDQGIDKLIQCCIDFGGHPYGANTYLATSLGKRDASQKMQMIERRIIETCPRVLFTSKINEWTIMFGNNSKIKVWDTTLNDFDPAFDRYKCLDYFCGMIYGPQNETFITEVVEIRTGRQSRHFNIPGYIYHL